MPLPHTLLTDGAHGEHVAFWTSALGRFSDDFHLRQPWLSPAVRAGETSSVDCPLMPATAALIDELGRGQDLGALVVVIGAAALVLQTYTGSAVVAMDSPPLSGRDGSTGADPWIPLVTAIDRRLTVREYLTQLSADVAASYSFQAFPIALVAERLLNRPRPATNVRIAFGGLHETSAGTDAVHDLEIDIVRAPALGIRLTGRTPAVSRDYLQLLADHLARALDGFAHRDAVLDDIDLLGASERRRLLVDYQAGPAAPPADRTTIHALFQQQAAERGTATAIEWHDMTMSYDQLNRQSSQLARFLQNEYGVEKGDVIGVLTHRAPTTVAGLLGVLKAGAVYLPIDPDYPEERLQFMVADAGVKVLLVQSAHFERLTALYETPMFALDLQLDTLETDDSAISDTGSAGDLAYIIYTSGSTGQPKAVLLEHGGFVEMVRHHLAAFGVGPTEKFLQFYGLSFDSSLFEVFMPLLSGATLVMVDRAVIDDPAQLSAYVEAHQVTSLTLPPVYSSTLDHTRLSSVTRYVSAGDHCRVEDALLMARASDYYNSYGPTETSVCATHHRVDPARKYGARIPIGTPITGWTVYLVDHQRRLVPDGVVGELAIGGAGLARGYLRRDDLTAQAFVPNPFADGERLYLTGDLAVWLPDGNLELIGRKDNQVKIRGYRVELGEIESVLDQHRHVKESAVVTRDDEHGNKRLVAYVTATGSDPIDVADLQSLLRSRLPAFMMPSAFAVLEAMPLTANGKIDRKALAARVETPAAAAAGSAPPETPVQETLVRIWQDVLGVAAIGIHDNLFDLGGDSILIIQIVSRAREAGLKLAPNQLFDHQTIATLSAVAVTVEDASAPAAEQEPVVGPLPLAPMQAWFFEQRFADAHHFNQAVSLDVPGAGIDIAAATAATAAVLVHHDALRLRFVETAGRWTATHAPVPADAAATSPFDIVDVTAGSEADAARALRDAIAECQSGFNLADGPLFRVRLIRFGDGRPSRLLVVAHHLVIDGVSWRILLEDFSTAYTQASQGRTIALPAKTTSFTRGTPALETWAPAIDSGYWLSHAAASPAALPVDHAPAPGANTVASAREVARTLDAATTTALLQDVPRTYATAINDVLLAGLAMTFGAWTGQPDVWIDLEGHGREELADNADLSRTVGWFTSQFPVGLTVESGASPGDVIKSVKEQLRAVPDRGAGYGVLRYLASDRAIVEALRQQPAPQVLFNYFGQAGKQLAPGLNWTLTPGFVGGEISARNARAHLIEINALVSEGCLSVTWTFSDRIHDRATIEDLAVRYEQALRALVDAAQTTPTTQFTPSDFPAAGLDQKSLDALLSKLNR
jgi:amino acid adenylation domain-containing protein/non-ribosomal peptide synthase protein (TIGR01720 family)